MVSIKGDFFFLFFFFKGSERLVIWLFSLFTLSLSSFSFLPCANEKGPLLTKVIYNPGAQLGSAFLYLQLNLLLQKSTPSPSSERAAPLPPLGTASVDTGTAPVPAGREATELSRHCPLSLPIKAEIWC